jgi:carboxyl-terminal processing protease
VKPGDLIIAVDGESTANVALDTVVARLKGRAGETVTLTIRRAAADFDLLLTRAVVEVPTVKYGLIDEGNRRVGYLELLSFSSQTYNRVLEALSYFEEASYTDLILDLRGNYGGLLDSAVRISDLFLDEGVIVSVKSRIEEENYYYAAREGARIPENMPVLVLIDNASASASEIVAGALKDTRRAYLVGTRSYGKGSVQQVFYLESGLNDAYKLTVARYYSPSDVNIDKIGIYPDLEVSFPALSTEDSASYTRLMQDGRISAWVEAHPGAAKPEIEAEALLLYEDYPMDLALLRRLIREEMQRTEIAPLYDLDYDVQLRAALDIIVQGTWAKLMSEGSTLADSAQY